MEGRVVGGTPPGTPLRRRGVGGRPPPSPRVSRRRSLFREESDLSDISPLSPSSEDKTPRKATPPRGDTTPLKGMRDMSLLSLHSPVVQVHSEGLRVRGVSCLGQEDVGSIPANQFYGSHTEPRPPHVWIRKEVSKAKTKLQLDDLPRDRKRARTSSGQKVQPSAKRPRRSHTRAPLAPMPILGQTKLVGKMKKKASPLQKPKLKSPAPAPTPLGVEPVNNENMELSHTKDFVTTEKDVEDIVGKEIIRRAKKHNSLRDVCKWDVAFVKESRLSECSTPSSDPSRKFFKNQVTTTPKMVERGSPALTPPWSSHKARSGGRKSLCKPNYVFSPAKGSPGRSGAGGSPLRRSPRKRPPLAHLAETISKDISEMMEEEAVPETKEQVTRLIQQLSQNDWEAALPSPEEEESTGEPQVHTPARAAPSPALHCEDERLYPMFRSSGKKYSRNPSSNSPCKSKKKSRRFLGLGEDQYQIDGGQASLREVQCRDCGLLYSRGCPEDEIIHAQYHSNSSVLTYHGWKKERVVGSNENGKVICVLRSDPKSWWNKVVELVGLVDSILGFPQSSLDALRDPQVYLFVRDKEVVGCLVGEQVSSGFRLLSLEQDVDLCSEESFPARCGVSRIWVSQKHRRRHVATSLLNTLRANFAYGVILRKEDLAFTVPTDDGKKFISKYMGQNTGYLVYM